MIKATTNFFKNGMEAANKISIDYWRRLFKCTTAICLYLLFTDTFYYLDIPFGGGVCLWVLVTFCLSCASLIIGFYKPHIEAEQVSILLIVKLILIIMCSCMLFISTETSIFVCVFLTAILDRIIMYITDYFLHKPIKRQNIVLGPKELTYKEK